jgi:hypothetical protein
VILEGKLFPFAQKCIAKYPNTVVQEDNASPYLYYYQGKVYNLWQIIKLLWQATFQI